MTVLIDGSGCARARIDAACTVNDVLRRHPEAVAFFDAYGVDACCGGGEPLGEAARDAGVAADELLAALDRFLDSTDGRP